MRDADGSAIVAHTGAYVRERLSADASGHDWWHVNRVWGLARSIARDEQADAFVVQLAALLHDVADWKFCGGDHKAGPRVARNWMEELRLPADVVAHVCDIIELMPYKGALTESMMPTLEGQIVQDADRLDAIGAIGIARAFAFGGFRGQPMHDPRLIAQAHASFEAYKTARTTTINHFHEKLLLLKDRMNTASGRRLAEKRHRYMEEFLRVFGDEWRLALREGDGESPTTRQWNPNT
jgi:uncharacterized protein